MHNVTLKVKLQPDGSLIPATPADIGKIKLFMIGIDKSIPHDVDCYLTIVVNADDKTAGQLAKVHALIREISNSTGHTFEEIKAIIKERAGLMTSSKFKSFADCNKKEMSDAIEQCINLGNELGIYLY
jgi:UDP-N-acetyl-D-mannosaminuronate dehydrogenase